MNIQFLILASKASKLLSLEMITSLMFQSTSQEKINIQTSQEFGCCKSESHASVRGQ